MDVRVEQTLPDSRRVSSLHEETTTSTFERNADARIERRLLTFYIRNVTSESVVGKGGAHHSYRCNAHESMR